MKAKSNSKHISKGVVIRWFGVAIVVVGAAVAAGFYFGLFKNSSPSSAHYNPQTKATKTQSGSVGGVVDNNTKSTPTAPAASPTPSSASITSASGVITLTSPVAKATIGNGTIVSGTATGLTTVQYRIKDTVRGVIATGALTVTNGSFSGTIKGIEPASSTGTFEVYDYNPGSGAEENDAKINVSFK